VCCWLSISGGSANGCSSVCSRHPRTGHQGRLANAEILSNVSAARHVRQLDARERNPFAIINMALAVAAAIIWLVALPAARNEPASYSSCEAILLVSPDINCGIPSRSLTPESPGA